MFTQLGKGSCNEDPLSIKLYGSLHKLNISLRKDWLSLIMLLIISMEMAMPHKVLAQGRSEEIATTTVNNLTLSSAVYAFNDRYVPEEIELRKKSKPEFMVKDKMTVLATAYSSTVDQCDSNPFVAASGKRVFDGMLAANFLEFGTKIRIPDYFGNKIFTVEDRMNKRFSERIDIWMTTREEALNFGVKKVRIEIVEENN